MSRERFSCHGRLISLCSYTYTPGDPFAGTGAGPNSHFFRNRCADTYVLQRNHQQVRVRQLRSLQQRQLFGASVATAHSNLICMHKACHTCFWTGIIALNTLHIGTWQQGHWRRARMLHRRNHRHMQTRKRRRLHRYKPHVNTTWSMPSSAAVPCYHASKAHTHAISWHSRLNCRHSPRNDSNCSPRAFVQLCTNRAPGASAPLSSCPLLRRLSAKQQQKRSDQLAP